MRTLGRESVTLAVASAIAILVTGFFLLDWDPLITIVGAVVDGVFVFMLIEWILTPLRQRNRRKSL